MNDPYYPLLYLSEDTVNTTYLNTIERNYQTLAVRQSFPIVLKAGTKLLRPRLLVVSGSVVSAWASGGVIISDRAYGYYGKFTTISGVCPNTDVSAVYLYKRNADQSLTQIASANPDGAGAWTCTADNSLNDWIVGFQCSSTSTIITSLSFLSTSLTPGWQPLPFIGTVDGTRLNAAYLRTASKTRVTASDLLVSNFNPEFYKNGTISNTRVPNGTFKDWPADSAQIMSTIAASPQFHTDVNMPLKDGLHLPWFPSHDVSQSR